MNKQACNMVAQPQDIPTLVEFALRMALQTENKTLNQADVQHALEYLVPLSTQDHFSEEGMSLIRKVDGHIVGTVRVFFESAVEWWLESVYVRPQHRRQGYFKALFEQVVRLAKQRGARCVKLYVESDNQQAKQVYFNLGMKQVPDKFYRFDFEGLENLQVKYNYKIRVECVDNNQTASEWCQGRRNLLNGLQFFEGQWKESYKIIKAERIVGYCRCFHEVSEWLNGCLPFIRELYLAQEEESELQGIIESVVHKLRSSYKMRVIGVRVMYQGQTIKLKGGEQEHYCTLSLMIH